MIDVRKVLECVPHFEVFCSVDKLHRLVERLREDARFQITVIGRSVNGLPIHHVRFGEGGLKALWVGFPHCKEPICGLTVYSLLTLLQQGHPSLCEAGIEWHIVPCIDPDGALLNEAWTQRPVTMERYMRGFYVQALEDQVDTSFPIHHKQLHWDRASHEANILREVLDRVLPDFLYSLHNAWTGGAFYFLSRDIGSQHRGQLYDLLKHQDFPLQTRPLWRGVCAEYGPGIAEIWSIRKHYDYLESTVPEPAALLQFGGGSWDYLERIKPGALAMVTEMGYVRHPSDESERDIGENLRRFKLAIDADSKYLGTVLIEEWERVQEQVDRDNPIYRAIHGGGVLPRKERLAEGGRPMSMQPTRDILFNPQYDRPMREADRFQACMVEGGFWFLCHSYQFVRLLKASPSTPDIRRAIGRLERAFDAALDEIKKHVDFDAFQVIECDTLAKVQLGSGLVVLNSLLEKVPDCTTTTRARS